MITVVIGGSGNEKIPVCRTTFKQYESKIQLLSGYDGGIRGRRTAKGGETQENAGRKRVCHHRTAQGFIGSLH